MKFLVAALFPEARPLIRRLELKKESLGPGLELYIGSDHALLVTGIGRLTAAVKVARALQLPRLAGVNSVINIGICGCSDISIALGTVFIANKIEEDSTTRAFFPDMLIRHPFEEATLVTVDSPKIRGPQEPPERVLYDMEASGVFQAAAEFITSDRLHFIKIVSDHLLGDKLSKDLIKDLTEDSQNIVLKFLSGLPELEPKFGLDTDEEEALQQLREGLRLTQSQMVQVHDWAMAYRIAGGAQLTSKLIAVARAQPDKQTKSTRAVALETLRHELGL